MPRATGIKTTKNFIPPTKQYSIQSANAETINSSNKIIYIVVGILVLCGILYLARGLFVAAVVNGEVIPRITVINQLEKQSGKRVLENMITQKLILQEAKKQNITVSDKEVDTEIARAEKGLAQQGQTLDTALAMQGITKDTFKEQIRLEKLVEAMLGKNITVTDTEVQKYLEANKDNLPESTDSAALAKAVKQQLSQQKLGEKIQFWLADLQKKAKIYYVASY